MRGLGKGDYEPVPMVAIDTDWTAIRIGKATFVSGQTLNKKLRFFWDETGFHKRENYLFIRVCCFVALLVVLHFRATLTASLHSIKIILLMKKHLFI